MLNFIFKVTCQRLGRAQKYALNFPYNIQLIERIKNLPYDIRKFDSNTSCWILTTKALYLLIKMYKGSNLIHFDFVGVSGKEIFIEQVKKIDAAEKEKQAKINELEKKKEEWLAFKQELDNNWEQYSEQVHKNLKENVKLHKHQIIASAFTYKVKNILISHEMGLGKSLSSLTYIEMCNFNKVIVITPNNLKFNYYNEINKFTNSKAYIVGWPKKKNKYTIDESKYIIFNYNFFNSSNSKYCIEKFNKLNIGKINALICDEAHALKNNKSNTYINYKKIFTDNIFIDNKPSKVFLSGTPCPSKALEMYNLLHEISPLDFPNRTFFKEYYCGIKYNPEIGGYDENLDEKKLEELYYNIAPFTHRKRKSECLDLPPKNYQNINFEMTDEEYNTYYKIEEGELDELLNKKIIDPLSIMIKLRKYLSMLKVKNITEIIDNILETGEKVVIVDFFKEPLNILKEKYGEIAVLHTGDEKDLEVRNNMVKEFQDPNSKIKIFLGSFETTKEGLTLTASSKLFLLFQPYVPGWFDQISDRIHRISQQFSVNIYSLIFQNSIDEHIFEIIENKRRELSIVMDGESYISKFSNISTHELMKNLINKLREKHKK